MDRESSTNPLAYATPVPPHRSRRWRVFSILAAASFGLFIDAYRHVVTHGGVRDGDWQTYGYALFRGPDGLSDSLVFVPYGWVMIGTALVCLTWVVAWRVSAHRAAIGNGQGRVRGVPNPGVRT